MCKSEDPMAGRLPCGIWGLMHAVSAEIAELHKCTMAHAERPGSHAGPEKNASFDIWRSICPVACFCVFSCFLSLPSIGKAM